ncbi:MAG: hypothetical protein CK424_04320 [Legionella sp.]|nr:MAG: hypothetical protein CK424_04320 [Legionella sp.]
MLCQMVLIFTASLQNRNQKYLVESIDCLHHAIQKTKLKYPFIIETIMILPEHIHTIWTLPDTEARP